MATHVDESHDSHGHEHVLATWRPGTRAAHRGLRIQMEQLSRDSADSMFFECCEEWLF